MANAARRTTGESPAIRGDGRKSGDLIDPANDVVWQKIRTDADQWADREPILGGYLAATVLKRASLGDALSHALATRLTTPEIAVAELREIIDAAYAAEPDIVAAARADLVAVRERDPASESYAEPLLFFKGFHALQGYRVANWLWTEGRTALAYFLQSRVSQVLAVDIHPAARIGRGIMIDHATGVVIGETAVVGDNVSILHEVTLGGTGKDSGIRHPNVGPGVLIGAGAKLLGNIQIGAGAKIGAGSVVLEDVCAGCTAAGVPAVNLGSALHKEPARAMDHRLPDSSP